MGKLRLRVWLAVQPETVIIDEVRSDLSEVIREAAELSRLFPRVRLDGVTEGQAVYFLNGQRVGGEQLSFPPLDS